MQRNSVPCVLLRQKEKEAKQRRPSALRIMRPPLSSYGRRTLASRARVLHVCRASACATLGALLGGLVNRQAAGARAGGRLAVGWLAGVEGTAVENC